mmetsp:Transcript_2243/g.5202  ORF Transcript_2243/g.5202 Transcript_2243/m.5202 type:complete len:442 (+) Transcript_2243:1-1326(+)
MFNAWEAGMVKCENYARSAPPKQKRSHLAAKEVTHDPGQACKDLLMPYFDLLQTHAEQTGGKVGQQTKLLREALLRHAELVGRAATMPKPMDQKSMRKEAQPLVDAAYDVAEYKDNASPRDPLKNHYIALAETAAMLGWVVAPAPVKHVAEYEKIVGMFTENILASFIELGCNPVHTDFAEACKALVQALAKYVREEHPAGLKWNYVKGAKPLGYKEAKIDRADHYHPLADYLDMIDGPLEGYMFTSQRIGGPLEAQSKCIYAAFEKQYDMVTRAAALEHQGKNYSDMKVMFMSTLHELNPINEFVEKAPKGYPFVDHLRTVSEFAGILMWPVIFDVGPATYTSDIETGVAVYFEKILATVDRFPRAEWHRDWIKSLKLLARTLRQYVTRHHNGGLAFDSRAMPKEIPDVMKRKSVAYQLEVLKEKNRGKVKHHEIRQRKR